MSSSRKSRWCPLPNEAPPTIKDSNTGIVYWDDMHYGSKWETKLTEKGAITFELDEEDLFSQEKDRQLALEAQQLRLQRVREAVKTPVQPEGPTTPREKKLERARHILQEYKWKNNGLAKPPIMIPLRSPVIVRGSGNFNEHMPPQDSVWKPTPRLYRDKTYVTRVTRAKLDLERPADFVNYKADPGQAYIVQAIEAARLSVSKGSYAFTRRQYKPVERELFHSPYGKGQLEGGKWASPPKVMTKPPKKLNFDSDDSDDDDDDDP